MVVVVIVVVVVVVAVAAAVIVRWMCLGRFWGFTVETIDTTRKVIFPT